MKHVPFIYRSTPRHVLSIIHYLSTHFVLSLCLPVIFIIPNSIILSLLNFPYIILVFALLTSRMFAVTFLRILITAVLFIHYTSLRNSVYSFMSVSLALCRIDVRCIIRILFLFADITIVLCVSKQPVPIVVCTALLHLIELEDEENLTKKKLTMLWWALYHSPLTPPTNVSGIRLISSCTVAFILLFYSIF